MNSFVLGIDIGTGSTKAVAVNVSGEPLLVTQNYYTTYTPKPGYSEQDPMIIWQAFVKCYEEITSELGVPLAICFSAAMHSLVPVNSTGAPLRPMMTWADARSEKQAFEAHQSAMAPELYSKTGTPLHPMSPLFKIIWLRENEPEVFSSTFKFISIKEFIWYKLFNEYQVDYSIASATGLFNIDSFEWNSYSLELAGIRSDQLSDLVNTNFTRNASDIREKALSNTGSKTVFVIGASDGCLANLGSFAFEPGTAALTIGTSGAVRVASATPIRNFDAMLFNYVLDEQTFISGGPVNNGGNTLQWYMRNISRSRPEDYVNYFNNVSTIAAGCNGLLFLPYIHGERAPIWDIKSSGCFIGVKSHHTDLHFARAVLEGMCFALRDVLQMVEDALGPISQLNVSGGIVLSETWQQILADISGKRICVVQIEDASAVGAAFMALKAIKIIDEYSIRKSEHLTLMKPGENCLIYQQTFPIYRQLYKVLKESMHKLYYLNQI